MARRLITLYKSISSLPSIALGLLLLTHAVLLSVLGASYAPTIDEPAHLVAGLSHWQQGHFSLYRVNPPLIRMLATAPLLLDPPEMDWSVFDESPSTRPEFIAGDELALGHGAECLRYFVIARRSLIMVSLMGCVVCFLWARELYGPASGCIAAALWCFDPNMLAWAATITPDAGAAAFGNLAAWLFWRWLKHGDSANCLWAGFSLGLALLTKSTWVVLFALWPLMWLFWRLLPRRRMCSIQHSPHAQPDTAANRLPDAGLSSIHCPTAFQLAVLLALGLCILNLGYGFAGTGRTLSEFKFRSQSLGGDAARLTDGNRFSATWIGNLPVPVPADYLIGIDLQKQDFEEGRWSYLRGEHRRGGWWYYYVYAFFVKMPTGFLALGFIAIGLISQSVFSQRFRHLPRSSVLSWQFGDLVILIAPCLAVLILVSSQTGFNRYLRYILPAFPFLYILASGAAQSLSQRHLSVKIIVMTSFVSGVIGSLSVFPYSMSYFNLAAGGCLNARNHLLDSNVDWGQDLLSLREWIDAHPEARPLFIKVWSPLPMETFGIRATPIPVEFRKRTILNSTPEPLARGWYAVSVNDLMGYDWAGTSRQPVCVHLQDQTPDDVVGYSIFIFHVTDPVLHPESGRDQIGSEHRQ